MRDFFKRDYNLLKTLEKYCFLIETIESEWVSEWETLLRINSSNEFQSWQAEENLWKFYYISTHSRNFHFYYPMATSAGSFKVFGLIQQRSYYVWMILIIFFSTECCEIFHKQFTRPTPLSSRPLTQLNLIN